MTPDRRSDAGFVYILTNPAMPGLVKIGLTREEVQKRVLTLSRATGVPMGFVHVYDELVSDCAAVERQMHEAFAESRLPNREFFQIPVREAIAALQKFAKRYPVAPPVDERVDILPALDQRFRRWLRHDLVGASIIHVAGAVYLEQVYQKHVESAFLDIEREDLAVIACEDNNEDDSMFMIYRSAEENAKLFLDLDSYTIYYLFALLNEEANSFIKHLHKAQLPIPFGYEELPE